MNKTFLMCYLRVICKYPRNCFCNPPPPSKNILNTTLASTIRKSEESSQTQKFLVNEFEKKSLLCISAYFRKSCRCRLHDNNKNHENHEKSETTINIKSCINPLPMTVTEDLLLTNYIFKSKKTFQICRIILS